MTDFPFYLFRKKKKGLFPFGLINGSKHQAVEKTSFFSLIKIGKETQIHLSTVLIAHRPFT